MHQRNPCVEFILSRIFRCLWCSMIPAILDYSVSKRNAKCFTEWSWSKPCDILPEVSCTKDAFQSFVTLIPTKFNPERLIHNEKLIKISFDQDHTNMGMTKSQSLTKEGEKRTFFSISFISFSPRLLLHYTHMVEEQEQNLLTFAFSSSVEMYSDSVPTSFSSESKLILGLFPRRITSERGIRVPKFRTGLKEDRPRIVDIEWFVNFSPSELSSKSFFASAWGLQWQSAVASLVLESWYLLVI